MLQHSDTPPLALDAYEQLAEAYAAQADTKPHNADYECPATLSLLPEVRGKRVLDAGCGPGVYAEWLLQRGAVVLAIDASPKMVALARQRLGPRADVRLANLDTPLTFLDDESFDLVLSPLVLDYIEDWHAVFREFFRVLRAPGHFVFSVGHPLADFLYFKTDNYFATEQVGAEWCGFGTPVYVPTYRRPLSALINPLVAAGFVLEHLLEPLPTEAFREKDPGHYAELMHRPVFVCVRARKG